MKDSLDLNIEEVCVVKSEYPLKGGWWFSVSDTNDKRLETYDIILPELDFKSYNYILSSGRKIISAKFMRDNSFPFRKTHFLDVILGKELYPDRWLVYRIDKI